MTTRAERKETIRRAIHDAFADVPYPGDDAITPPSQDPLQHDIAGSYRGHHWRDLPQDVLDQHDASLVFMRPAARQFYLPAYLLHDLDRLHDEGILYWRAWALDPPDHESRFARENEAYTPAQREAIRLFLAYVRGACGDRESRCVAKDALERYWARDVEAPPRSAGRERKEQVKQAIRDAFSGAPYPGDLRIVNDPEGWESRNIQRDFGGYPWRQLPRALAAYWYNALSYLSVEGLRFYLPTYLFMTLDGLGDTLPAHVMSILGDVGDLPGMHRRFDGYTPAQKAAVRRFLEHVRDVMPGPDLRKGAQQALAIYWGDSAA